MAACMTVALEMRRMTPEPASHMVAKPPFLTKMSVAKNWYSSDGGDNEDGEAARREQQQKRRYIIKRRVQTVLNSHEHCNMLKYDSSGEMSVPLRMLE
jgi:hypothetical protein